MNRTYEVGGHRFAVSGDKLLHSLDGINGFQPFLIETEGIQTAFVIEANEEQPVPAFQKKLYTFQYEDIDSIFGTTDKGYRLDLCPDNEEALHLWMEKDHTLLWVDGNVSPRLLRFAIWMAYGIMTAAEYTASLHSSCIVWQGKAVLFLGESGTGKSTHTSLWLKHIEGSRLLNDDSPMVRYEDGEVWVYGSPWSGKTPCYKAERYPLAACVRLSQAPQNAIRKLNIIQAMAALHPSTPPAFAYDSDLYDGISRLLDKILSHVPVYHLACLPNKEAAELSCQTVWGNRS